MMKSKKIYTATEARKNFFKIIENVMYDRETAYVKKAGSDVTVKIEVVKPTKTLNDFFGCISDSEAKKMKKAISEMKSVPDDPVPVFPK